MTLPVQLINFAVANAMRQTTREDAAAALIAALRCVRCIVNEREGFASVCALDDGVREYLLMQRLRDHGSDATKPCPLPQASWSRTRQVAIALLEDAVAVIMSGNGVAPVGLIAGGVVHHLLGHLIGCLGGLPDADELLAAIRGAEGGDTSVAQPEAPAVIRIH